VDRRGFLSVVGLGGIALAASPQLLLPRASIAVPDPQPRIFIPPTIGWPVWRSDETVADFLRRFEAEHRRRDSADRLRQLQREHELGHLEFLRQIEAQPYNATGPAEDTWKIEGFMNLAAPITFAVEAWRQPRSFS